MCIEPSPDAGKAVGHRLCERFDLRGQHFEWFSHRPALHKPTIVLIKKSGTVDINELTRERLERSIRVHEEFAEFLTFAGEHLVGRGGKQRLTAAELQVLDLMPRQTFD